MSLHQDQSIERASRFALLALLRLEEAGLVPPRFTAARLAAWRGLMPHCRTLDLFELAVRDGVRANPHLFAAFVDPEARNELRALNEGVWLNELERLRSSDLAGLPVRNLYALGAETLDIDLPPLREALLGDLHLDRSSLVAELPNGCGYPSLVLCERDRHLDAAHNLRVFVDGPEATMLAAWAVVLLTGQLMPHPDPIVPVSAEGHASLTQGTFQAALIYRAVPWLVRSRSSLVAQEVVEL